MLSFVLIFPCQITVGDVSVYFLLSYILKISLKVEETFPVVL